MKKKAKAKAAKKSSPPPAPKSQCFRCDGSGKVCNTCGESERVCSCGEDASIDDCPDCKGTGK